jgi:hypothetical protein
MAITRERFGITFPVAQAHSGPLDSGRHHAIPRTHGAASEKGIGRARIRSVYHRLVRAFVRFVVVPVGVVAVLGAFAMPYVDALAFIARAAGMTGAVERVASWRAEPFVAEPIRQIPTRHGAIDAQLYRPAEGEPGRAVTLVPGVHMDGIRETRLVGMAEDLAASGFTVLTVASPDLQRFRITPESTDIIEDAATWLAAGADGGVERAHDGKVGMLGISFSGGLSIVAAGRPALRDKVS